MRKHVVFEVVGVGSSIVDRVPIGVVGVADYAVIGIVGERAAGHCTGPSAVWAL